MTYACANDLKVAFGETEISQLTDRDGDGSADSQVIDRALKAADGEINSYLAVRYKLPLPLVPQILRDRACDIARYRLYNIEPGGEPEERYKAAIAWLKDLSAARAVLVGITPGGGDGSAPGVGHVRQGQTASNFDWDQH